MHAHDSNYAMYKLLTFLYDIGERREWHQGTYILELTFLSKLADASWESRDKILRGACLLSSKKTNSSPKTICHVINFSGHHTQTNSVKSKVQMVVYCKTTQEAQNRWYIWSFLHIKSLIKYEKCEHLFILEKLLLLVRHDQLGISKLLFI